MAAGQGGPAEEEPGAPRWRSSSARVGAILAFANWWIDNRQAPNGEFGNNYNDDTDLVGDWISLHMIADRDGKLFESVRRLADFTWNEHMRNGLNIISRDPLHAYEEGNNVQPYVALMDYGNPVRWERLLATARRYDGFLLTDPAGGGAGSPARPTATRRCPRSGATSSSAAGTTGTSSTPPPRSCGTTACRS